jgi:hypothetical protein
MRRIASIVWRRRRRRIYSYSMILQRDPGRLRLSQGASLKPDESEGCLGWCNYVELIDTIFTDVEGVD